MKFYVQLFFARNVDSLIVLANKYVFHGDLEKIIEVTYSYREIDEWFFLNETLFEEYTGLSFPEHDILYLCRKYKYKISVQIVLIDEIIHRTRKINVLSRSDSLRRWLFIDALEYIKNILEISVLWADFEMEKAWVKLRISDAKKKKILKDIEKKERIAFGKKVSEIPEEFSYCYNFVTQNHEKKKKNLSQRDSESMSKYLTEIQSKWEFIVQDTQKITKKSLKDSFLKIEIPRKDYRKIFDAVCELYGLPQRTKITNAGSIYDGDYFLEIPRNEAHAKFSIERILKLLTHEIESHYINAYNGKLLLWNFRWAKNLPKEEWLAKFMEKIFVGYDYENIDSITESFFTIMAGEILKGNEFVDFMRIMGREYACKKDYKSSVARAKRNYSLDFSWVQHKDVVYFRWLSQTLQYLKEWWEFRKLFLWKVWFDDLENIDSIWATSWNKDKLVFPLFISDIIYYYCSHKIDDATFEFKSSEYYLYIKKKYWFLGIESFKIIPRIDTEWKQVEKIIKMFEKAISAYSWKNI